MLYYSGWGKNMQTISISESLSKETVLNIILEALGYGFFGAVFVIFCDFVNFALTQPNCPPNFYCDTYVKRGIPFGLVFIGAVISVLLVNFLFGKIIKAEFKRWFLILVMTSITAILMQTVYIISDSDLAFEQIMSLYFSMELIEKIFGLSLILKLFLILTPFTILFASRWILIEKLKANNYYPK